ncbi:hypothetical protein ACLKA7_001560 [Drosophila subpalustris]
MLRQRSPYPLLFNISKFGAGDDPNLKTSWELKLAGDGRADQKMIHLTMIRSGFHSSSVVADIWLLCSVVADIWLLCVPLPSPMRKVLCGVRGRSTSSVFTSSGPTSSCP